MSISKKKFIEKLRGTAQKSFIRFATVATMLTTNPNIVQGQTHQQDSAPNNTELSKQQSQSQQTSSTINFTEAQQDQLSIDYGYIDELVDMLNTPVSEATLKRGIKGACIGNLDINSCLYSHTSVAKEFNYNKNTSPTIKTITLGDENYEEHILAGYSPRNKTIYMMKKDIADYEKNLSSKYDHNETYTYNHINNNPVALNSTVIHEINHHQSHNLGVYNLDAPSDIYIASRIDEKISHVVQYLNTAHQYSILKEQGIETIQFNGKKTSTNSLLDFFPGLREYITENGFSAKNQKDIDALTKIACKHWEDRQEVTYKEQFSSAIRSYSNAENLFDLLKTNPKQLDKTINKMVNNVYIGHDTYVNLSREDLDNMNYEQALEAMGNEKIGSHCSLTFKDLSNINSYYESIGITKNSEKTKHLTNGFLNFVSRYGDMNEDLKSVLLKDNHTITYPDDITLKKNDKGEELLIFDYEEFNLDKYYATKNNTLSKDNVVSPQINMAFKANNNRSY